MIVVQKFVFTVFSFFFRGSTYLAFMLNPRNVFSETFSDDFLQSAYYLSAKNFLTE